MTIPGRVTIAIATFNRSALALRAVKSALGQTYSDIEVIVSDDASTDDTARRIKEIRDERLEVHIQNPRLGVVGNCNFLLEHARGEFYIFMGDDDMLMPDAISKLVEPFLAVGDSSRGNRVGVSWSPCLIADRAGTRFWTTEAGPKRESIASFVAEVFAGNRGPRCSSILLRTQDAVSVGGYNEKYGDLSDIGNWARAAMLGDIAICIREPVVQYTMHHGSMTSRSSVRQWQHWAMLVHSDLAASARARGDINGERKLRKARKNFLSGITLTILIQTIGKPGWIRNAARQAVETPEAIFTPYMLRRLLKDGRKVFTLRRKFHQKTA